MTNLGCNANKAEERLVCHAVYKTNSIFDKCGIEKLLARRQEESIDLSDYNEEIEDEFESFKIASQLSEAKVRNSLLNLSSGTIQSRGSARSESHATPSSPFF